MPETTIQPTTVAECIAAFVAALNAEYGTHGCVGDEIRVFGIMPGERYTRIVVETHHDDGPLADMPVRSAFCFVDDRSGDILECDGWERPATKPRGNIFTATFGMEFVGPDGFDHRR